VGVKVREKETGSGVWWVFIAHKGKRRSKRIGSRDAAERVKAVIEAQIKLGQFSVHPKRRSVTLQKYYDTTYQDYLDTAVKPSTAYSYVLTFKNYILPELGHFVLSDITRGVLKGFIAGLVRRKLARNTIASIMHAASGLLQNAVDDEVLSANPVRRMRRFYRNAPGVADIEPLTTQEVERLLTVTREKLAHFYPVLLCALHAGLRIGELRGLRWADVDFNGRFLLIRHNVWRRVAGTTKGGRAARVDLSDALLLELKTWKAKRREANLAAGRGELTLEDTVFLVPDSKDRGRRKADRGGRMGAAYIRNLFKRALQAAGIRDVKFHNLRHTFVTQLLMAGHSPVYVSQQARHKSIQTTIGTYSHWIPGHGREAMNTLPSDVKKGNDAM